MYLTTKKCGNEKDKRYIQNIRHMKMGESKTRADMEVKSLVINDAQIDINFYITISAADYFADKTIRLVTTRLIKIKVT